MKNGLICGDSGYAIPCLFNINGPEKTVCIVVHGFSSSKTSPTAVMMLEELPQAGIGAIAFDLPAHGESKVDGEHLRIAGCLADLAATEAYARRIAPEAEIVYFASSFGAYITLIYLAGMNKGKQRAFLRSAAVTMPRIFQERLTPERKAHLEATGEFTIYKEEYGYARDMKLTKGFFDDLQSNDVFDLWREGMAKLRMIHGESDQTVPIGDAISFAEKFDIPIAVVPCGDHQLSIPGAPGQVLAQALEHYETCDMLGIVDQYERDLAGASYFYGLRE